jgi:hypothetical protein
MRAAIDLLSGDEISLTVIFLAAMNHLLVNQCFMRISHKRVEISRPFLL